MILVKIKIHYLVICCLVKNILIKDLKIFNYSFCKIYYKFKNLKI